MTIHTAKGARESEDKRGFPSSLWPILEVATATLGQEMGEEVASFTPVHIETFPYLELPTVDCFRVTFTRETRPRQWATVEVYYRLLAERFQAGPVVISQECEAK